MEKYTDEERALAVKLENKIPSFTIRLNIIKSTHTISAATKSKNTYLKMSIFLFIQTIF